MRYPINTFTMIFVVTGHDILDTVCSRIEKMGFTVNEPVSIREASKTILGKTIPVSRVSSSKTIDGIPEQLLTMLKGVSSKITNVVITLDDLSEIRICSNDSHHSLTNHPTLGEVEREHIVVTLEKCGWCYKTAAKLLGIDRSTIYRKMKKYGIKKGKA